MTKAEKYYDMTIAPALLELAKDAQDHDISLLAVCEYAPGETGRTAYLCKGHSLVMSLTNAAAQCRGNVDSLWMWVQRYAMKHGHSSIFLQQQDIPAVSTRSIEK